MGAEGGLRPDALAFSYSLSFVDLHHSHFAGDVPPAGFPKPDHLPLRLVYAGEEVDFKQRQIQSIGAGYIPVDRLRPDLVLHQARGVRLGRGWLERDRCQKVLSINVLHILYP